MHNNRSLAENQSRFCFPQWQIFDNSYQIDQQTPLYRVVYNLDYYVDCNIKKVKPNRWGNRWNSYGCYQILRKRFFVCHYGPHSAYAPSRKRGSDKTISRLYATIITQPPMK